MPEESVSPDVPVNSKDERLFLVIALSLAVIVGVGCLFAVIALTRHESLQGIPADTARQLSDFSLVDSADQRITRADLDGKVLAVSFVFTSCGTTCPEVSRRMAEIQRHITNEPDVRLVSLTVDPRSDTPPVLTKWGARYGADTNCWLLLTGSKPVLYQLISTSFLATNSGDAFNSMPGNFTGTERIALVDKHGRVRIYYDGTRRESSAAVVAEIEQLRKEN